MAWTFKSGIPVLRIFLASLTLLLASTAFAFEHEGARVAAIHVDGLKRTRLFVPLRELEFKVGDILTEQNFNESLRRLRNVLVFDTVSVEVKEHPGGVAVRYKVVEKWTTIPIFKLQGTRGVTHLATGIYDINTLGRYWEMGAEYHNLNGEDGALAWAQFPRFLNARLSLLNAWRMSKSNHFYYNLDRKILGGFSLHRQNFGQQLEWEMNPLMYLSLGWAAVTDEVDDSGLDDESKADNLLNAITPGSLRSYHDAFIKLRWGQVNRDSFRSQGQDLQARWGRRWEDKQLYYHWSVQARIYIPLWKKHRFAARVLVERSDDPVLERMNQVGGLDKLRGHLFEQLRSNYSSLANLEYRHKGWGSWLVLQPVLFFDSAFVDMQVPGLTGGTRSASFYGAGGGIRLMIPRIHRFVGRLDYGRAFGDSEGDNITFGFQQFF